MYCLLVDSGHPLRTQVSTVVALYQHTYCTNIHTASSDNMAS